MRVFGDWGTTRLRLWRVEGTGAPLDRLTGPGIGQLRATPDEALREALAPWLAAGRLERITLCGMAGARNGLREAPYADCPAAARQWRRAALAAEWHGAALRLGAGLACRDAQGRPDVMRGEEAQIYGALRLRPELGAGARTFVLPGTHSKWATVRDGAITGFRTFLTGELYALLQGSSLLAARAEGGDAGGGFAAGLERAGQGGPVGALFEARSRQLRDGCGDAWAREFLSGLLIGSELAEARQAGLPGLDITLIGDAALTARYARAIDAPAAPLRLDGDACVLAGLGELDADD